jgi:glycosyltransferase involved in cell wall biosynthesis
MKDKKHILFLSQHFPPDITAAAFRVSETVKILKEQGFKVTVITAQSHPTKCQQPDRPQKGVVRVPIIWLGGDMTKHHLLNYLSFMVNTFVWGAARLWLRPDWVIATSPPLFSACAGWALARIKGAKFMLDVRDIWPASPVDTGHLKHGSLLHKSGKCLERFIYRRANSISCVCEDMRIYIERYTKRKIPVFVLYNGVYQKLFNNFSFSAQEIPPEQEDFVISYVGNIGYPQALDILIEAAKHVVHERVRFVLVGEGTLKRRLQEAVEKAGIKNITFHRACGKEKAVEFMQRSHALLLILKPNAEAFRLTIPSKVFDYLWTNKPILYSIEGQGRRILSGLASTIWFDASSVQSLIAAVKELRMHYQEYKEKAQHNRELVLKNFTREKALEVLRKQLLT